MVVRLLRDTEYAPKAEDSPRCYGQLRYRTNGTSRPRFGEAGVSLPAVDGARVLYFPKGAQPDLDEATAIKLIQSGDAEEIETDVVEFVSVQEITKDLVTTNG